MVAGEYASVIDEEYGLYVYGNYPGPLYDAGLAEPSEGMVEYIQTTVQQNGKYVVTIKLFGDAEGSEPLMENGQAVEFQVYLTIE